MDDVGLGGVWIQDINLDSLLNRTITLSMNADNTNIRLAGNFVIDNTVVTNSNAGAQRRSGSANVVVGNTGSSGRATGTSLTVMTDQALGGYWGGGLLEPAAQPSGVGVDQPIGSAVGLYVAWVGGANDDDNGSSGIWCRPMSSTHTSKGASRHETRHPDSLARPDRQQGPCRARRPARRQRQSPVVHTPQVGKQITGMYLRAAAMVLMSAGTFRYLNEWYNDSSAVLEFEAEVNGITINGVDMIFWNAEDRIDRFKVMVRPLKAVNMIHEMMGMMLKGGKA